MTAGRHRAAIIVIMILTGIALLLLTPGRAGASPVGWWTRPSQIDSIARLLKERLEPAGNRMWLEPAALTRFYMDRGYAPAWADRVARRALLAAIDSAAAFGLDPDSYHRAVIAAALLSDHDRDPAAAALLDIRLSDAFLALATHRAIGRLDPRDVYATWQAPPPAFDAVQSMRAALGGAGIGGALAGVDPVRRDYARLREELARARADTSWLALGAGPTLAPGDTGARVARLRHRLGVPSGAGAAPDSFDAVLDSAVRRFQKLHGLETDGVVGRRTIAMLDMSPAQRADRIALALERLRWLPGSLEPRRVEVIVPGFELRFFENGRPVLASRVIGGRRDWPTPPMTTAIRAIVVNPYWNVPERIFALEVLPALRRNAHYLETNDMEIVSRDGQRVAPSTYDWNAVSAETFTARIRQRPGPANPLGRVKFVVDNPYDVYLHDTPDRAAFDRADRALSHGCIRVDLATELATTVMRSEPSGSTEFLDSLIASKQEVTVRMTKPVPVYIIYATAWIDESDNLQIREDLYGLDRALERRLANGTRASPTAGGECPDQTGTVVCSSTR